MTEKASAHVDKMIADAIRQPNMFTEAHLKKEEIESAWADFGRMVSKNIHNPDFLEVLTRAGLKSKNTGEMLGFIRAFILTGVKP